MFVNDKSVRYLNVSLNSILNINEKVEQHRKSTNSCLKFWIEDDIISLWELTLVSFLFCLPSIFLYLFDSHKRISLNSIFNPKF